MLLPAVAGDGYVAEGLGQVVIPNQHSQSVQASMQSSSREVPVTVISLATKEAWPRNRPV